MPCKAMAHSPKSHQVISTMVWLPLQKQVLEAIGIPACLWQIHVVCAILNGHQGIDKTLTKYYLVLKYT
jgi:hypothetical protein